MSQEKATATQLILIRHGETHWNVERRMQGQLDSPLTVTGELQALAVATRLAQEPFQVLYSSDLGRARQTAQRVAQHTAQRVVLEPGLRERHLGMLQGLTQDQIQQRHGDLFQQQKCDPDFPIAGGETSTQAQERFCSCLEQMVQRHPGQRIVAITHGDILSGFVRRVLGLPFQAPRRFSVRNGSLNTFSFSRERWILETWGELPQMSLQPCF